jgi:hypothetical protein
MFSFKEFISESISPGRERYLARMGNRKKTREDRYKEREQPTLSDEEKDAHVNNTFNRQLLKKVRKSHDPSRPIGELSDDAKALGRAIVYHFDQGTRKKEESFDKQFYPDHEEGFKRFSEGHHMIRIARHAMRTHLGDHFAQLLPNNQSREVLRRLFAKR